jgi:tetratricopeptide (TPR) repeat protein
LYRGILKSLKFNEEHDPNHVGLGPKYKYKVHVAYAENLIAQDLYKEAEEIHVTLIALSKDVNGDKDPQTLRALKTLAWIKVHIKKLTEAEELYKEALALYSEVYGERHIETLEVALPYADLLYSMHRGVPGPALRAVNDLYHRILNVKIEIHENTELSDGCFQTISRIADIETALGDLASAEGMLRRAQRVAEGLYGIKRPQTIATLFSLASIIMLQEHQKPTRTRDKQRSTDALALYRRVLVAWKVTPTLGPVHPETLKVIVIMAGLLFELDAAEDAMELLERAVVACERSLSLGKDSPETIKVGNYCRLSTVL